MTRMKPNARRSMILNAAIELAKERRSLAITREEVAQEAQVSESLVSAYFNTMHQLKKAVVRHALLTGDVAILAIASFSEKYRPEIPDNLKPHVKDYMNDQLDR